MSADIFSRQWLLNPALRMYDAGEEQRIIELDDRYGRVSRMAIANDAMRLLERFRHACSWPQYRNELAGTGVDALQLDAIGAFFAGPCRDKRILIEPGEARLANDQARKPAYLNVMIEVLPSRIVNAISSPLQCLFAAPALIAGGCVVAVALLSMFVAMHAAPVSPTLGAQQVLGVGAIAVIGLLLHELGHAAAAYRLGARRVSIGIGWYLVIPVAYSELSELWRYPRRSRVIVDLAGVYMQGLLLTVLMLLFYALEDPTWLVPAGATATSMLWNLNPFLRMDGYWAVADALGIPDLRRRAIAQLSRTVNRLFASQRVIESGDENWAVLIYAALSSMFLGALLIRAVTFLGRALTASISVAANRFLDFSALHLTAAEWALGAIALLWQALLLCIAARFVATSPARLLVWWRSGRPSPVDRAS